MTRFRIFTTWEQAALFSSVVAVVGIAVIYRYFWAYTDSSYLDLQN